MSRQRNYSDDSIAVMVRYFAAADVCIAEGLVKNVSALCEQSGIDKRAYYAQRKELKKGSFQVGWLLPLVRHYAVSPMWLLTGQGKMFRQPPTLTIDRRRKEMCERECADPHEPAQNE